MPSLILSALAFLVSVTVAWLTFFRRSVVSMSQPPVLALEYTPPPDVLPSVSLSTLLFAKSNTWPRARAVGGVVIENMYVKLSLNETSQSFLVWYHGNERSGLFVGEAGVAQQHRFFPSKPGKDFRFAEGSYRLDVLVSIAGEKSPRRLFDPITLPVPTDLAKEMATALAKETSASVPGAVSLQFSWEPESKRYLPSVQVNAPLTLPAAPDYGPPALTLPNGETNSANWALDRNRREQRPR